MDRAGFWPSPEFYSWLDLLIENTKKIQNFQWLSSSFLQNSKMIKSIFNKHWHIYHLILSWRFTQRLFSHGFGLVQILYRFTSYCTRMGIEYFDCCISYCCLLIKWPLVCKEELIFFLQLCTAFRTVSFHVFCPESGFSHAPVPQDFSSAGHLLNVNLLQMGAKVIVKSWFSALSLALETLNVFIVFA